LENDQSIADLMSMIARHYQTQITDPDIPKNKTRQEVIRKLELISQSIKGLMKHEQETL
jgi:hypothetical protein